MRALTTNLVSGWPSRARPAPKADCGPYVEILGGPNFLPGYDIELGDELGEIDPDYEAGYSVGGDFYSHGARAGLGYRF